MLEVGDLEAIDLGLMEHQWVEYSNGWKHCPVCGYSQGPDGELLPKVQLPGWPPPCNTARRVVVDGVTVDGPEA